MAYQAKSALEVQLDVLGALMLRDIRTRFGGTMWGYSVAVLWPCAHILVITAAYVVMKKPTPIGDSIVLFAVSGLSPYIIFNYMSKKMMEGPLSNRQLVYFPQVKFFDVVMSRAIVEVCTSSLSIFMTFFIAACFGAHVVPRDSFAFCEAMLLALFFATGAGFFNVFISQMLIQWQFIVIVPVLIVYFTSGTVIVVEAMPAVIYDYVQWNPLMHIVKVCRSAFYPGYGADADVMYVLIVSGTMALIGLLGIRFVVPRFLN
ncbi:MULTISPECIES: ABC transporter permease [Methylobacterium]|jgi:capsular polysaccharide transport system permease protein|uniref:ABC transporter permease n=1 Tax=Methylobacterium TaxID=407 RepID=UPI0008EDE3DA|nr:MULTISPECIES: ABC transporter permease [Methylobacterium]MBZ6413397.1 ABC transporter permease [Methylobacterium sp.]MBK3397884.1 ABC transporter permease [Methylobacterium ajmalii]MBK3408774.1 ABC transporter permease [Methylobacterium ajmalii]MBK3423626.1 ABC transporter permease [Methylobacterium ajmalii]SFE83429.1 capsular polysaccharide transport system permease protein [Methylobacterium sp. yr596]